MDGRRRTLARLTTTRLSLALGVATLAGCGSNKLETGYAYSPLGASAIQRRAYYAGPFSPEAREAALAPGNDTAVGPEARRPRMGNQ